MCQIQFSGPIFTPGLRPIQVSLEKIGSKGGQHILKQRASLSSSLEFLCFDSYWPGMKHPLIENVGCVSDVPRVHTKLKLVTGVYVLQVNRACFNQNNIDATCQLCHQADETVSHFLLDCPVLESVRRPLLEAICNIGCNLLQCPIEPDHLLQLIFLDSSCVLEPSLIIPIYRP